MDFSTPGAVVMPDWLPTVVLDIQYRKISEAILKKINYLVLAAALGLAGCNTTGTSDGPTSVPDEPAKGTPLTPKTGGLAAVATLGNDGIDISRATPTSLSSASDDNSGNVTLGFTGGGLDGRTLSFVGTTANGVYDGEATPASLQGTESQGFLTALDPQGKASLAGVLNIDHNNFENPGDTTDIYSEYGANPNYSGSHTLPTGSPTLAYSGSVVGLATTANVAGGLSGNVNMSANFASGDVSGTMSGLQVTDSDTQQSAGLADVAFTAQMSGDHASYSGSDVTIGNTSAQDASIEGGFYGVEAAETAGAIYAHDGTNGLIGGFQADKQ